MKLVLEVGVVWGGADVERGGDFRELVEVVPEVGAGGRWADGIGEFVGVVVVVGVGGVLVRTMVVQVVQVVLW